MGVYLHSNAWFITIATRAIWIVHPFVFFSLWMEYVTESDWCDSEIMEEAFETFKRDRCAFDSSFCFLDGFTPVSRMPIRSKSSTLHNCPDPRWDLSFVFRINRENNATADLLRCLLIIYTNEDTRTIYCTYKRLKFSQTLDGRVYRGRC